MLNKALTYVRSNEATVASLAIVHCYEELGAEERQLFEEFERSVELGKRRVCKVYREETCIRTKPNPFLHLRTNKQTNSGYDVSIH